MTLDEKNKLIYHLGECLLITPNDDYLKKLFINLSVSDINDSCVLSYSKYEIGLLRAFLSKYCIKDLDVFNEYDYNELRHDFDLTNFIINNLPKDLFKMKMVMLKKQNWYNRNDLEKITNEIINNEIKKFYQDNQKYLHIINIELL
jgi:hypothetical protein